MPQIQILPGDPRDPAATALLQASHALMQDLFDPEDNHFLSIDDLCVASVSFFVAKEGPVTLGCAAVANRGSYGEIKSMFVDPAARGKGIANLLMTQLEAHARSQGLVTLNLETGDKLAQAVQLYSRHGFAICGPFGDYEANPSSIFMTKDIR